MLMTIKPGSNRKLSASDEKQLQQLLMDEYQTPEITSMWYSYPKNDNRLLLEYTIAFYDNERTQFFRKARKKNGLWELDANFRTVHYRNDVTDPGDTNIADIINKYLGD